MRIFITLFFLVAVFSSIAFGKLYVWVDKDGVKHMSNIPPKENVLLKEKKEESLKPSLEKKEGLILENWFPTETKAGYTLSGEVKNNSKFIFTTVLVRATIKDDKGKNILQRDVNTDPLDIQPGKTGKFKIENVKTQLQYLTKKHLRFDIFNGGKIEKGEQLKKPEFKIPVEIEFTD